MNLYVFDVDGVLTDPIKKQSNKKLLIELSHILKNGNMLAFNTGRSLSWVQERILNNLFELVGNKALFGKMLVVGEKGNTLMQYEDQKWSTKIMSENLPQDLIHTIRKLIQQKFNKTTFFDESKLTMISTEMKDGANHDEYVKDQKKLHNEVEKILSGKEYKDLRMRIDPTIIALDIQEKNAGKHLGAQRIETWLQDKGYKPESVYMVGDSKSDIEMAEELQHLYPVTFVFVNEPDKLGKVQGKYKVVYTKEKFEKGTLEFLKS